MFRKSNHKTVAKNSSSFIKKTYGAVFLFYFLIGFEFLYMASPFAAYFYSVYRPGLELLDNFPAFSWLAGFFLPHLVEETKSPVLNLLKPVGAMLAVTGFLIFIISALQVYYSKLLKKGFVAKGLYKFIRHPQYTGFALCSFGLLILWPRYLVLIIFITLLFIYYFLARTEEKECEKKFGESYKQYLNSTYMFLPLRLFKGNTISFKRKIIVATSLYVFLILLSIQTANLLKQFSIDMLYTYRESDNLNLSIFESSKEKISDMLAIIKEDSSIKFPGTKNEQNKMINYVLPVDMYISEIPMVKPENPQNHIFSSNYSLTEYKIISTRAKVSSFNNSNASLEILYNTLALEPLSEVWVDLEQKKVIKKIKIKRDEVRYENIPEPVF